MSFNAMPVCDIVGAPPVPGLKYRRNALPRRRRSGSAIHHWTPSMMYAGHNPSHHLVAFNQPVLTSNIAYSQLLS